MDKNDINLMHLKNSKSSKKSGYIFGNLEGVKDFHSLGDYPIEALESKTVNELATMFIEYQNTVNDRFGRVIDVLKYQKEKIEKLERKLETYGL